MTGARMRFRRMVVGLPQGRANPSAVEAAANLAELLQIELLATFLADATLSALAGLPAVRELRALDVGWQAIDVAQIARDIDYATGRARRHFAETVGTRAIKSSFDVVTGAAAMAGLIRADDIVAIIEPAHPGERITRQFAELLDAAFAAAGAVLIVPRRIARTSGPIVALATDSGDECLHAALQIAAALNERLVVVTAGGARLPDAILAEAQRLGVKVETVAGGGFPAAPSVLSQAETRLRARLRVLSRGALTEDARRLFASLHGIPLLVVEPSPALAAAERPTEEKYSRRPLPNPPPRAGES